jgi:hypothetical protein
MHALYELKDMLCKELEEIGEKGELTAGTLDTVDKLAHSIKNICKIIDYCEEEEYSNRGMSYEGSYENRNMEGMSRARGGRGGNRGGSRRGGANQYGSYRGYSRAEDMASRLEDMMHEVSDDRTRQEISRLAAKMREM